MLMILLALAAAGGDNTISGNALLRTVGGDVRTCAGLEVNIVPEAAYSTTRIKNMFQSVDQGFLPSSSKRKIVETEPEYSKNLRSAICDAQGNFTFEHLPDGAYFVMAQVTWGVPLRYYTSHEGGTIMQRVSVAGGEVKRVVLTAP